MTEQAGVLRKQKLVYELINDCFDECNKFVIRQAKYLRLYKNDEISMNGPFSRR